MVEFWNFIINVLVICSSLILIWSVFLLIYANNNSTEIAIRALSCACGFLIYLGAKAVGFSIPDLILESIKYSHRLGVFSSFITPGVLGVLFAAFTSEAINDPNDPIPSRLIAMFSVFVVTAFSDIYLATVSIKSAKGVIDISLIPNLSFIICSVFYVIFNVKTQRN